MLRIIEKVSTCPLQRVKSALTETWFRPSMLEAGVQSRDWRSALLGQSEQRGPSQAEVRNQVLARSNSSHQGKYEYDDQNQAE
jgi:hypothetical protein